MNLIDYLTRNQLGAGYARTPRGELLQTVRKEGIKEKGKKGGKTRRKGRRDITVADLLHANRKCGECRRDECQRDHILTLQYFSFSSFAKTPLFFC